MGTSLAMHFRCQVSAAALRYRDVSYARDSGCQRQRGKNTNKQKTLSSTGVHNVADLSKQHVPFSVSGFGVIQLHLC